MDRHLRLGTRGSPLALYQANLVAAELSRAHEELRIDIEVVRTTGDRIQDRTLAELGGKGLFAKEIEEKLLSGGLDLAVHSMKDMETELPAGLRIAAILPREDPRDAFLSRSGEGLDALPDGARIGTASVRRRAQLLHCRPDLEVVPLRGNVETRLRKLQDGEVDATLLALAGLRRLEQEGVVTEVLDMDRMLPAAAQGAIGAEIRTDDDDLAALLAAIDDEDASACVSAERALLAALDGTCHTPIGAFAALDGAAGTLSLQGLVARPDGSELHRREDTAPLADANEMATAMGQALRAEMGPGFFQ